MGMPAPPSKELMAIHFAGPRVLVYSNEEGMKRCLTAAARKNPTGPLADGIREAGGKKNDMVLGFSLSGATQQRLKDLSTNMPQQAQSFLPLLEVTSGTVVSVPGVSTSQVDIKLTYPDADRAGKAKKAFDELKALGEKFLPAMEEQMKDVLPPDQANQSSGALKKLLAGITAEVAGNVLKIRMDLDTKALEALTPKPGAGGFVPDPGAGNNPWPGNPNQPKPGRGRLKR
jgi:hypothetical protein